MYHKQLFLFLKKYRILCIIHPIKWHFKEFIDEYGKEHRVGDISTTSVTTDKYIFVCDWHTEIEPVIPGNGLSYYAPGCPRLLWQ